MITEVKRLQKLNAELLIALVNTRAYLYEALDGGASVSNTKVARDFCKQADKAIRKAKKSASNSSER